ncbi:MAG TPA: phage portal protein [Paracoccaceae bacterium]|nr:phage portal protein [Paracoccaceae bacterium]
MAFGWIRRAAGAPREAKASAAGAALAVQGAMRPIWSPRDRTSLTRQGFAGNVIGFRCVRMIAEAAASAPLTLSDGVRRLEVHPVLRLLGRPNPGQLGAEFLEAVYGHLLLSGDAYVEAAGELAGGGPAELYPLRPDRMSVAPGPDGWPEAYEYAVGGRKVRFTATGEAPGVLHLRSFHPLDDHHGMSPLEAAAASVDVHNAAGAWAKALLDNAARPSGAIVYRGPEGQGLSDQQYNRLMEELSENHAGARNAGRPMLLEGGLDWRPMGFSPSDMEFLETRTAAARDVAIAFGVPPMLLGLPGDATYANYQEANRAFWRQTVLPLVSKVAAGLADWLSRHRGEVVTLTPDLDRVSALAPEREALWRRVAGAEFLSEGEKRAMLGLPAERPA